MSSKSREHEPEHYINKISYWFQLGINGNEIFNRISGSIPVFKNQ